MSGLSAVVSFKDPIEPELTGVMSAAVPHRGSSRCVLATSRHAELCALNAGPGGHVVFSDGAVVVVADARIDNRVALMGLLGLSAPGPISDAALIAAAYRRWGTGTAARLLGDFAFVVWDDDQRTVYAARDVIGLRPLFVKRAPQRMLLASEIKQILAVPGVPVRFHEAALTAYLAGQTGPLNWTFYQGIDQIPPGNQLVGTPESVHVKRYWDPEPDSARLPNTAAYAERLFELLEEAVSSRLADDQKWGLLLSGGLDSGGIAAAAGTLHRNGGLDQLPRAFSWQFDELSQCDERAVSDPLAQYFGLPVTHVLADDAWPLKGGDPGGDRDSPNDGPFQVLHELAFARASAEGVKGLLWGASGDLVVGSDDYNLLAGLSHGKWGAVQTLVAEHGLRSVLLAGLIKPSVSRLWPPHRARWARDPLWRWQRAIRGVKRWPDWLTDAAIIDAALDDVAVASAPASPRGGAYGRRYERIFDPWTANVHVSANRAHAKAGLGFADPWSDRRLVEFALSVPESVMGLAYEYKPLLRAALEGTIPESQLARADKVLLLPLYERGVKQRERETVNMLLAEPLLARYGFVDAAVLRDRAVDSTAGVMWCALSAEAWLRKFWVG